MESNFMDKLIHWRDFEQFVRDLYALDPSLTVQHDVLLEGKSGAKRQIDVLITHKLQLHTYRTLVECKRWQEKVDRPVVDVMYAAMEDLNAAKGVIFTTKGYEEGAQQYAASKNIDIFIIRDLRDEEWGLPGRVIHFYLHIVGGNITQIAPNRANMMPVVREYPSDLQLEIIGGEESLKDDSYLLYSSRNGEKGPNLIQLLQDKQLDLLHEITKGVNLLEEGKDKATMLITSDVVLDMEDYEFNQLRLQYGALNLQRLRFQFQTHITQSVFHHDRGEQLKMAVVVENYVCRQKHLVTKRDSETTLSMTDNMYEKILDEKVKEGEVLQNNSIMKVFCDPYIRIELRGNEQMARTEPIHMKLNRDGSHRMQKLEQAGIF